MSHVKVLVAVLCCLLSSPLMAAGDDSAFYHINEERLEYVKATEHAASNNDKLLLLVIGANWCHDSRALAEYLQTSEVSNVIQQHYELAVIDAAWLDNLSHVLTRYNHPAYFGTPSVMVIAPDSATLLNRDSVQRWQSAHSESAGSFAHYLSSQAENGNTVKSPDDHNVPAALSTFEQQQAEVLYQAYAKLGPLLAAESKQQLPDRTTLDKMWNEVRRFRYQLQHDLVELHRRNTVEESDLPEYAPLKTM
ncbi:hypothetical protein OCL06_14455 [Alteromonas sp. ASW11-19]|uniref:Thioredoxin family protein n=1 Tax=Alteromonas salexigens TaxID=2982530 RepID=A0ABT2VU85_9ALTE|nr:hypothetical protein [Alteromonas salexigens]MCU7555791.1 hypothetical protein [Alteromonas salexigens]